MMPSLTLHTQSAGDPALDTAISGILLRLAGAGEIGPTARLHRAAPSVAFGRADRNAPGYPEAVAASERHGFAAIERLAGGRAAVFHEETLAFSLVVPASEPRTGISERFETITAITVDALLSLGVDARVGEVPGEYCPGAFSVNARAETKLAGFGQRLVGGAAHVGGVVVADGSKRIRDVLVPVYAALGLAWRPATVGSVADEGGPGTDEVAAAIATVLADRFDVRHAAIPAEVVDLAAEAAEGYRPRLDR